MKKLFIYLILIIPVILMTAVQPALCKADAPPALREARQKVMAEFDRLDEGLRQAAKVLGTSGLTGEKARPALAQLCTDFDYAADCAAVDLQGRMVTIEPAPYRQFEGKDISSQEQIKRIVKTGKPVLSKVFRSVEGFPAADVEYPVISPGGQRLGSVSILFQPEKLLGKILVPLLAGIPVDIWVMEKEGLILYDVDSSEIGLNLFTSKLYQPYAGLIRLGRRIAAAPEGNGVYKFRSGSSPAVVRKKAFWQSVALYGTEWRLVAIHVEQKDPAKTPAQAATMEQKLESFAASGLLIKAMSEGEDKKVIRLFQEFYDDMPGIYSVQWVDAKDINRFGYPRENSLNDYDYNTRRSAKDQNVLDILAARKPAVLEVPLLEGRTGICTFRPVFNKDWYLGMAYYIRLKQ